VKISGRDEPMWVAIHMCIEATLGISLYSSLSQTSKKALSFLLSLMFSLQQNQITRGDHGTGSPWKQGRGRRWLKQCTHVSKCKNNKIKIFFK
jgi:hypothetical protein